MENSKRPKVQNMNDFVNAAQNEHPDETTRIASSAVTRSNTDTAAKTVSAAASNPAPAAKAQQSQAAAVSSAERQRRSQHVATGMRSSARSSQQPSSGSRMQTVQVSRNAQGQNVVSRPQQRPQQKPQQNAKSRPMPLPEAPQREQRGQAQAPMRKGAASSRKYTDIREERRAKLAAESKKQVQSGKKKMGKWGKFLIILSAALLLILIIGCIIFNSFLKSYEDGQHSNVAASVVKEFSSTDSLTSYLKKNSDKINCLEDFDNLVTDYAASLEGKKISYVYDAASTAEEPRYNITADGTLVGKVTMVKDGKGAFGLTKWKVGKLDITSFIPGAKSYNILVPEGSTVTVNGTQLDESYITGEGIPEVLKGSVQFIKNPPSFTTYTVSGFTRTPEVSAVDASGSSIKLAESDSTFMAGQAADQAFVDEVKPLCERGLESWATYFIYMSHNLDLYILKDSEVYKFIFGGDDYDPINPWLYNWEQIVDYNFSEFEVSNIVKYTDDCFACDVKYHLDITFSDPGMSDNNQGTDATWVWVADGDSWSIADVIYH
ncbi:MAG: hypothetical protein IKH67_02195 [Lachnospiraceae bacterium]|nr:hypothetical protein [Lachnospiraceae bacterium]